MERKKRESYPNIKNNNIGRQGRELISRSQLRLRIPAARSIPTTAATTPIISTKNAATAGPKRGGATRDALQTAV